MLQEIFGQAHPCVGARKGELLRDAMGLKGWRLWCGGDPVWGSEDVENPALGSVPCPQAVLVLWIPEEQVYEGKNQKRGTRSQWGP